MQSFCYRSLATVATVMLLACVPLNRILAAEVHAAVAANFTSTMATLIPPFEASTGHRVIASYGSSGTLYAQIKNGAPFEVFLSADVERPRRLVEEGNAIPESRFTYAMGKLVLWSTAADLIDAQGEVLRKGDFQHLAIANPKTAPYGIAAQEVLNRLGLWDKLQGLIVQGENITQTFQFVASGNAELGFVAASQLGERTDGSFWIPPQSLYGPIEQQAVLLTNGQNNPAAVAFLAYLRSKAAISRIEAAGYKVP